MFSTFDEPSYGAIILLSNGSRLTNISGCIALVDGDESATGCGAKDQAYQECRDTACISGCATFEAYDQCWVAAGPTVCSPQREGAVCWRRPSYAICTSYNTSDESFIAMAKIFCVSGLDGGTTIDSGMSKEDAGEAETREAALTDGEDP